MPEAVSIGLGGAVIDRLSGHCGPSGSQQYTGHSIGHELILFDLITSIRRMLQFGEISIWDIQRGYQGAYAV